MTLADRELLAAALDALPIAVTVADDGGTIVFRNRRARTMAGARDADVIAARTVEEQLVSGLAAEKTLDLFGPPRRSLVVTTQELERDGTTIGAVAIVDDITERRQIEAIRRDFVANVSHELRTPVGALGVLAETLAEESDPAVVARLCGRIASEADRAARIIDDLLDLSRIEAESVTARQEIDVRGLVDRAVDQVAPAARRSEVALEIAAGGAARVLGDEGQLLSAVANLLDNAVKYSDPGATVHVNIVHREDDVLVTVTDQGIGIPQRDLDRVFERFFRVDRGRSRSTGGTGLGLAIVRHVAANHGGQVTVTSREGEGSTFTLRLPGVRS